LILPEVTVTCEVTVTYSTAHLASLPYTFPPMTGRYTAGSHPTAHESIHSRSTALPQMRRADGAPHGLKRSTRRAAFLWLCELSALPGDGSDAVAVKLMSRAYAQIKSKDFGSIRTLVLLCFWSHTEEVTT
jgi:hypothetical protein